MKNRDVRKGRWWYFSGATAFVVLLLLVLVCPLQVIAEEMPDGKGTDFWLAFPPNYQAQALNLFIAATESASGTVSIEGVAFSEDFTVEPGLVTTVSLPLSAAVAGEDSIEDKGIHVVADKEVSIYGLNRVQATTDAYMGLPTNVLGTEYIVLNYLTTIGGFGSTFSVVATQDNTEVTITPTETVGVRTIGVPYVITLQQGEVYQLESAAQNSDLSGTIIESTLPVAVYGSVQCVNIPSGYGACDYIVEQLPPTETWGTNFVTMPLATRLSGDTFRILASEDTTTVTINGTVAATLDRGEFFEQMIDGASEISADHPVLVAQYSNSTNYDGITSDPFMMLIPPYEQFQSSYTLTTPAEGFSINFTNLVVPAAAVGEVTLDGVIIDSIEFSQIGSSNYYGAQLAIELGSHTFNSAFPFGAFTYGFASADSYGYPGGSSYSPVASVADIAVTPAGNACTLATLTDSEGIGVYGVRVDFVVSGANEFSGFTNSDLNGEALFCYTPENSGLDSVTAAVGALTSVTPEVSVVAQGATNTAPSISGTPQTSVLQGGSYSFTPVAADAQNDPLTFTIENQPSWAQFDAATGQLSGTPQADDVDTTQNIVISVSDGVLASSLEAFDLTVLPDADLDGIDDASDDDDDNDGTIDTLDAFPYNPLEQLDTDSDGIGNNSDNDDDNDGIVDSRDSAPLDDSISGDFDQDGIQDHLDDDIDNDGVLNGDDDLDYDADERVDSDGDGVGDNSDLFPTIANVIADGLSLAPDDDINGSSDLPGVRCDGDQDESNNLDSDSGAPKMGIDYTFQVVVKDPQAAVVQVVINGAAYEMYLVDGDNDSGGYYTFTTELGPAPQWSYYFQVLDADGAAVERLPADEGSAFDGPQVELLNGMNMVSVPKNLLTSDGVDGSSVFGSDRVYLWRSSGLQGEGQDGSYELVSFVERGQGYFCSRQQPVLPDLSSFDNVSETEVILTLQPGWNLISNPYRTNLDLLDVMVSKDGQDAIDWLDAAQQRWLVNAVYSYNGDDWGGTYVMKTPGLFSSVALIPWMSYWVYLNQDDGTYRLILSNPVQE